MKSQVWISKKFLFIIDGKKSNFNKALLGGFSKSIEYTDLLIEVKLHFVSQHLSDDSDKFADTMPQGIVMSTAFRHWGNRYRK